MRRKSYVRFFPGRGMVQVRSTLIRDLGLPGRGPKLLPIPKPGGLGKYGYRNIMGKKDKNGKYVKLPMTQKQRRTALARAIRIEGPRPVIGHLVLITNYNHRTNPKVAALFRKDQQWVSKVLRKMHAQNK